MSKEREEFENNSAAKHWHDLYLKECLLRQDDAARFGQAREDAESTIGALQLQFDLRGEIIEQLQVKLESLSDDAANLIVHARNRTEQAEAKLADAEKNRDEWKLLAERRADQILSDQNDATLGALIEHTKQAEARAEKFKKIADDVLRANPLIVDQRATAEAVRRAEQAESTLGALQLQFELRGEIIERLTQERDQKRIRALKPRSDLPQCHPTWTECPLCHNDIKRMPEGCQFKPRSDLVSVPREHQAVALLREWMGVELDPADEDYDQWMQSFIDRVNDVLFAAEKERR